MEKGREILRLVNSNEWKVAKEILDKNIKGLDSISSLKDCPNENKILEIRAREICMDVIKLWIDEVEAIAQDQIEEDIRTDIENSSKQEYIFKYE